MTATRGQRERCLAVFIWNAASSERYMSAKRRRGKTEAWSEGNNVETLGRLAGTQLKKPRVVMVVRNLFCFGCDSGPVGRRKPASVPNASGLYRWSSHRSKQSCFHSTKYHHDIGRPRTTYSGSAAVPSKSSTQAM